MKHKSINPNKPSGAGAPGYNSPLMSKNMNASSNQKQPWQEPQVTDLDIATATQQLDPPGVPMQS